MRSNFEPLLSFFGFGENSVKTEISLKIWIYVALEVRLDRKMKLKYNSILHYIRNLDKKLHNVTSSDHHLFQIGHVELVKGVNKTGHWSCDPSN